jgi:DNA mismatch repair ATPase MutS
VVKAVDQPLRDLALLAQILAVIEAERFESPKLRALRAALDVAGLPASKRVARLRLLVDLLDGRRNQLFAPIAALVLWTTQLALAIEAWRGACGPRVPGWIAAVGEIEALCALSGFAYERPGHPFPEVVPGEPRFEARGLGHPLIPPARCVRNDLRLDPSLRLYVVSGSNMSGKSTLLRSVGTNAALAHAGAPVCADALRISPLSLGASIRIQDSLQEGASRFYAEITRLGQLVARAQAAPPLLFLLDEILAGTNSHDRRIGAEAVVRGLLARGAFGLVTTHDLALARIADHLAPAAANVHFEDQLVEGRMHFDFRLRPGVVQRSNALALMRAVGLDVGENPGT